MNIVSSEQFAALRKRKASKDYLPVIDALEAASKALVVLETEAEILRETGLDKSFAGRIAGSIDFFTESSQFSLIRIMHRLNDAVEAASVP